MSELKTLAKSDPDFYKYLWGNFSKDHRAIPVQSLNVSTEAETVTFKLVPVKDVIRPIFFLRWAQILKIKNFILLAFPIFVLLVKNNVDQVPWDPGLSLLNILGCACLLAAMNLRNDFRDHLSGLDRIHPDSGSRAIQLGWLTASQSRVYSFIFAGVGALLGLPALLLHPQVALVLGISLILIALAENSYRSGLKYRWWTELLVFLLFGPLFTLGFQTGLGLDADLACLSLGVVSGWLAVFIIHIRNFEAIMVNSQVGFSNSVQSLGFESSKKLLLFWWFVLVLIMDAYHWFFSHLAWFISFSFVAFVLTWMVMKIIASIKSPVSSKFRTALDNIYRLSLVVIALWVVECMSYLLMKEIG